MVRITDLHPYNKSEENFFKTTVQVQQILEYDWTLQHGFLGGKSHTKNFTIVRNSGNILCNSEILQSLTDYSHTKNCLTQTGEQDLDEIYQVSMRLQSLKAHDNVPKGFVISLKDLPKNTV